MFRCVFRELWLWNASPWLSLLPMNLNVFLGPSPRHLVAGFRTASAGLGAQLHLVVVAERFAVLRAHLAGPHVMP